jgi:diaminopimelate decarboxylase/aspartate kinase
MPRRRRGTRREGDQLAQRHRAGVDGIGIGMWQQVGFLADVFERFKRHGLSVDLIGSSEANVTVSLDPSDNLVNTDVLEALCADLAEVCRVKVIAPCAAVTLVGRGMRSLLHKLSEMLAEFGRERVHLISQSSNDLNLTFVVDETDADGMLPRCTSADRHAGAMPVTKPRCSGRAGAALNGSMVERATPWWHVKRERLRLLRSGGGPRRFTSTTSPPCAHARACCGDLGALDRRFYAIKANPHPGRSCARWRPKVRFGMRVARANWSVSSGCARASMRARAVHAEFCAAREYADALQRGVWSRSTTSSCCSAGRSCSAAAPCGCASTSGAATATTRRSIPAAAARSSACRCAARRRIHGAGARARHAHHRPACAPGQRHRNDPRTGSEVFDGWPASPTPRQVGALDIGGGLGVPTEPTRTRSMSTPGRRAGGGKAVHPAFRCGSSRAAILVAEAGVLLTREPRWSRRTACTASGRCRHERAAAPGAVRRLARHREPVAAGRGRDTDFDVVGPICESSDVLRPPGEAAADTAPGDVLLVADRRRLRCSMAKPTTCAACPQRTCSMKDVMSPTVRSRRDPRVPLRALRLRCRTPAIARLVYAFDDGPELVETVTVAGCAVRTGRGARCGWSVRCSCCT